MAPEEPEHISEVYFQQTRPTPRQTHDPKKQAPKSFRGLFGGSRGGGTGPAPTQNLLQPSITPALVLAFTGQTPTRIYSPCKKSSRSRRSRHDGRRRTSGLASQDALAWDPVALLRTSCSLSGAKSDPELAASARTSVPTSCGGHMRRQLRSLHITVGLQAVPIQELILQGV